MKIGVELEGFSHFESCVELPEVRVEGGRIIDETGLNQIEFVTDPQPTISEVMSIFREMERQIDEEVFVPTRPGGLMNNRGVWHNNPRYDAIKAGLRIESPSQYFRVCHMTEWASLQSNISGDFDPLGDAGAFLSDLYGLISPFIARQVHSDLLSAYGHLQLWTGFADPRRLPSYHRWIGSGEAMVKYIESVPRLIKSSGSQFEPLPDEEFQSVNEPIDLGLMWWLARPKRNQAGEAYFELRYLPSMPLTYAERYLQQALDMFDMSLGWFFGANVGQPVETRDAVAPLLKLLNANFADYVPSSIPSKEQWLTAFRS